MFGQINDDVVERLSFSLGKSIYLNYQTRLLTLFVNIQHQKTSKLLEIFYYYKNKFDIFQTHGIKDHPLSKNNRHVVLHCFVTCSKGQVGITGKKCVTMIFYHQRSLNGHGPM